MIFVDCDFMILSTGRIFYRKRDGEKGGWGDEGGISEGKPGSLSRTDLITIIEHFTSGESHLIY